MIAFYKNRRLQKPQGKPPLPPLPPPPRCESSTPSRDETHMGSSSPSSRFCRQMARKKIAFWQVIFSAATKRKLVKEGTLLVYVPGKHPNTYPRKISYKTLKFSIILIKQQKRWNFAQHELQKEKANDRKQLYEANHLYLMIAIITKNVQETYHLKTSLIVKTTSNLDMKESSNFRR